MPTISGNAVIFDAILFSAKPGNGLKAVNSQIASTSNQSFSYKFIASSVIFIPLLLVPPTIGFNAVFFFGVLQSQSLKAVSNQIISVYYSVLASVIGCLSTFSNSQSFTGKGYLSFIFGNPSFLSSSGKSSFTNTFLLYFLLYPNLFYQLFGENAYQDLDILKLKKADFIDVDWDNQDELGKLLFLSILFRLLNSNYPSSFIKSRYIWDTRYIAENDKTYKYTAVIIETLEAYEEDLL